MKEVSTEMRTAQPLDVPLLLEDKTCPRCGHPQAQILGGAFGSAGSHSVRYRCHNPDCRHRFSELQPPRPKASK